MEINLGTVKISGIFFFSCTTYRTVKGNMYLSNTYICTFSLKTNSSCKNLYEIGRTPVDDRKRKNRSESIQSDSSFNNVDILQLH